MGLRDWLSKLLGNPRAPRGPSPSRFGPGADRHRQDLERAKEFEFEVEKQKGWPRGH